VDEKARPIRVLLVDDHEMVLSTMAAVMRLEPDFQVVGTAMTIEGALEHTAALTPDVVVIDYRLPDGDGVAATRQIREIAPEVRVVMLTGMDDPATRADALEAGCSAFVAKGARIDELAGAVRTAAEAPKPAG
jgi:two-component system nitrate/nitrite response regulator NarL